MKSNLSECRKQDEAGSEAKDEASFIERRLFYLNRSPHTKITPKEWNDCKWMEKKCQNPEGVAGFYQKAMLSLRDFVMVLAIFYNSAIPSGLKAAHGVAAFATLAPHTSTGVTMYEEIL
jgi:hypothetical protein